MIFSGWPSSVKRDEKKATKKYGAKKATDESRHIQACLTSNECDSRTITGYLDPWLFVGELRPYPAWERRGRENQTFSEQNQDE